MKRSSSALGYIPASFSFLASSVKSSTIFLRKSHSAKNNELRINVKNWLLQCLLLVYLCTISWSNTLAPCREIQGFFNSHLSNMNIILANVCRCLRRHKLFKSMTIISNFSFNLQLPLCNFLNNSIQQTLTSYLMRMCIIIACNFKDFYSELKVILKNTI